jgi:hypothetical protein
MESMLAIAGTFLFLCMGMALPMVIILSGVYLVVKRRQWTHMERMKMIENGLISEEKDFEKAVSSMRQFEHSVFFDIAFYLILLFLGFIFVLFSTYAVAYFLFLKMPAEGGLSIFAILSGILLTFVLMVLLKLLPSFYRHRRMFLASCMFLGLFWGGLFVREIQKISPDVIKARLQEKVSTFKAIGQPKENN